MPLRPGRQHHREREVRVARRVGRAELDAGRVALALLRQRHAHERRAVVARPALVDRRLVAGDQPLVGVDPLVGDRDDLARVHEEAGDEVLRHLRQAVLVARIVERVHVAFEERQVRVHPRTERTRDRLGHEGRVHAVVLGDFLGDEPERHHVVGHRERVGVAEVDLVLARAVLVERVLHRDAHRLEAQHGLLAELGAEVVGGEVEVAGVVERLHLLGGAGVEELHLGADEEGEALLPGALEVALQHVAGVAVERVARKDLYVAEHPRDGRVGVTTGQQLEGVRVGLGQHVGFLDPAVALDGRAVEGHALLEGDLELGRRDLDRLQEPEHIGEPEADETHAALLDGAQDVLQLALHAHSVGTFA